MNTKRTHRTLKKGGLIVASIVAFSALSATAGVCDSNHISTVAESEESVTYKVTQDSADLSASITAVAKEDLAEESTEKAECFTEEDVSSGGAEDFMVAEVPEVKAIGTKCNDEETKGTVCDDDETVSELVVFSTRKIASPGSFSEYSDVIDEISTQRANDLTNYTNDMQEKQNAEAIENYTNAFSWCDELRISLEVLPQMVNSEIGVQLPLTSRVDNLNVSREEVIANAILPVSNDEYEKLCKMVMAESGYCSWEMQNGCASAAINEAIRQGTSLWDALTYPGRFVFSANINGSRRAVTMEDINASVYDAVNQALLGYDVNYETIGGSYGFWAPNYCSKKVNDYFYAHVRGTCMIENVCFYHDWV